jgi:L-ascorbate metabolism protein UlaG (beta-lactamase superfamily)
MKGLFYICINSNDMKSLLSIFLLFVVADSFAQRAASDVIETSKGPLTIQPVKHASLVLTWNNATIYADPNGPAKDFEGLAAPDLVLITDIHGDHFNPETLKALDLSKTTLVVPQAVADKMTPELKTKAIVLGNGNSTTQAGVTIAAIPMYNLPESSSAMHTKGRGNGYVLTLGNTLVYISGDTAGIPEMRALKNIDVAFVCMNLPYTMDVNEAALAVLEFRPKVVYPYHSRGKDGLSDTEAFKKLIEATFDSARPIDVRLRNWYPN